ncbi:unnamed protein product [Polarella glacialis]|uniref:Ubiquitin-like domain-containing protein n=1 Tax=Polarella glacialis TaxID=89957 RepID=A0A813J1Y5_POLGL|nr:unnamed protein product [Polarella glacialis]
MVSGLVLERKALEAQLAAVNKSARTCKPTVTAEPNTFQIFIRPQAGATRTYDVKGSQTIKSLKVRIMQDFGFKVDDQQLTLSSGRVVEGNRHTLKKWGIASLSRLDVATRWQGGGKRAKAAIMNEHETVAPIPSDPVVVVETLKALSMVWTHEHWSLFLGEVGAFSIEGLEAVALAIKGGKIAAKMSSLLGYVSQYKAIEELSESLSFIMKYIRARFALNFAAFENTAAFVNVLNQAVGAKKPEQRGASERLQADGASRRAWQDLPEEVSTDYFDLATPRPELRQEVTGKNQLDIPGRALLKLLGEPHFGRLRLPERDSDDSDDS